MKKTFVLLVIVLLASSFVLAVIDDSVPTPGQGEAVITGIGNSNAGNNTNNETGQGNQTREANQTQERDDGENGEGSQIRDRVMERVRVIRENLTFLPYQLRNESECLEGCNCRGAVMECETEEGRVMTIQAGKSGNILTLTFDDEEVNTSLEVEVENASDKGNKTRVRAKLQNGERKQIMVMPETAAEKALERVRLRTCNSELNCTLELKEVPVGNEKRLAYEMHAERPARVLGLFRARMEIRARIDAENGEVIEVNKPWWAFLATEPEA